MRKKRLTAAEIVAKQNADPEMRLAIEGVQARVRQQGEAIRAAQAPLLADLRAVGIDVSSVSVLVNTARPYEAAIPILLEHLDRPYDSVVRDGIARALATPEAAWAWDRLLVTFLREPPRPENERDVKYSLGLAIAGAATEAHVRKLLELVRDRALGSSRLALVDALLRSKNPLARETLEQLRDDPDLKKELRLRLGRPKKPNPEP